MSFARPYLSAFPINESRCVNIEVNVRQRQEAPIVWLCPFTMHVVAARAIISLNDARVENAIFRAQHDILTARSWINAWYHRLSAIRSEWKRGIF